MTKCYQTLSVCVYKYSSINTLTPSPCCFSPHTSRASALSSFSATSISGNSKNGVQTLSLTRLEFFCPSSNLLPTKTPEIARACHPGGGLCEAAAHGLCVSAARACHPGSGLCVTAALRRYYLEYFQSHHSLAQVEMKMFSLLSSGQFNPGLNPRTTKHQPQRGGAEEDCVSY